MDTKWSLLVTIQLSLFLFGLASSPPAFCHENERSVLLEFKKGFFNKTSDSCYSDLEAYRKIESWKLEAEQKNCYAWDGVECDTDRGHVIGIELGDSCLSGSVTSNTTLFHLVHLQRLNLSYNYRLTGQVPPEILNMTNLLSFDLSGNDAMELKKPNLLDLLQKLIKLENLSLRSVNISAPVPNIVLNSSSLRSLRLDDCYLQGEFPPTFFKMPKLEFLDISNNYELSGHLPEFRWRSSLKSLRLDGTNFSGHIPSSLGNLTSLYELDLSSGNFIGQIPSSIGYLAHLTKLSFEGNHLTGEIPNSIGNLTQLVELFLNYNLLIGAIPSSIGKLSNLKTLVLGSNRLTGEIPSSFINLTKLTDVNLMSNKISGQVLPQLTKLPHLSAIDLRSNNLNGTVRISLFSKLKKLHTLLLSFNKLSFVDDLNNINTNLTNLMNIGLASCNLSSFPTFLQRQEGLSWLDLSCNNLNGDIPEWFLSMHTESLRSVNLSSNLLTSSMQRPLNLRWKLLFMLDLRENNLKGPLPIPSAQVYFYFASRNKFSGNLPSKICELGNLEFLDLSENYLTGVLPKCLHNLSQSLSMLSLSDNRFIGEISSIFSNGVCHLEMVDLSSNRFNGSLPRSLTRCTELSLLNIGNNQIRDNFPSWLGTLPNLKVLILHSNEFHGAIGDPEGKDMFPSLQIVDLSSNNFESCLPSGYFKCWQSMKFPSSNLGNYMEGLAEALMRMDSEEFDIMGGYFYTITLTIKGVKLSFPKVQNHLTVIDLSSNNFSCEIPRTIESLVEVQYLNFSNNNLIGPIPSFLKALTQLEALDLSQNKLSGKIPQELTQLTFLEKFNVSYNNLTGSIPEGRQFATFSNDSYFGNAELCGLPLSKNCEAIEELPQPEPQSKGEGEESIEIDWKVVLMGCGCGLVIGVIVGQEFTIKPPLWMFNCFSRRAQMKRR